LNKAAITVGYREIEAYDKAGNSYKETDYPKYGLTGIPFIFRVLICPDQYGISPQQRQNAEYKGKIEGRVFIRNQSNLSMYKLHTPVSINQIHKDQEGSGEELDRQYTFGNPNNQFFRIPNSDQVVSYQREQQVYDTFGHKEARGGKVNGSFFGNPGNTQRPYSRIENYIQNTPVYYSQLSSRIYRINGNSKGKKR
jgi:hypothetical protein